MNKKNKVMAFGFLSLIMIVSMASFGTSGIMDWFKTITGKATSQPVSLNITVGNNAPRILYVSPMGSITIPENATYNVQFNFTAYDADGFGNLVASTVYSNLTRAGEPHRPNYTCVQDNTYGIYYSNFSCIVTLWYFDEAGDWNVSASINDSSNSISHNTTQMITVQSNTAFVIAPGNLTFAGISPGSTNTTANQNLTLNNTGNVNIATNTIQINATSLRGESDSNYGLWAGNFTVGNTTSAGANPVQCDWNGTMNNVTSSMIQSNYANISGGILSRGNHSINDGVNGQERFFVCLTRAGNELTSQSYSTANEGSWTIKVQ